MPIRLRPYKFGSYSYYLRIPHDIVNFLEINKESEFGFLLKQLEDGRFALIYHCISPLNEEQKKALKMFIDLKCYQKLPEPSINA